MDPEIKSLLERNTELAEENNRLLRKMNRRANWGTFIHLFYWILIIGTTVASYYYIEPYLKQIFATYQAVQAGANKVNSFNPLDSLKNAFNNAGK